MSEETLGQTDDQEFEEINSDEIDRIVEVLDNLIEGVDSDNVKHYLEEASSNIYYLIYEDSEDEVIDEPLKNMIARRQSMLDAGAAPAAASARREGVTLLGYLCARLAGIVFICGLCILCFFDNRSAAS